MATNLYEKVKAHPMFYVCSVLCGLLAGWTLMNGWNWIFSDMGSIETKSGLVNVNSCEIDLSDVKIMKTFNKDEIVNSANRHIVLSSVTPRILGLIKNDPELAKFNFHIPKVVLESNIEKMNAESNPSGDNVTKKIPVVKMESNPSGDSVTKKIPLIKVESNPSGDNITKSKPKINIESIDAEIHMWKDREAQLLINNRILGNMYRVVGVRGDKTQELLNCLFIRGRIALVPTHLKSALFLYDSILLMNSYSVKYLLPVNALKFVDITNRFGNNKEASLMYVDSKYVANHSDIVKHFQTSFEMGKWRASDITMPTLNYLSKLDMMTPTLLGNSECKALDNEVTISDSSNPTDVKKIILREGFVYSLNTKRGDCGSPIVVNESKVLRKICGIHNAGAADGKCYGESISQADLLRALNVIPAEHQIIFDIDDLKGACIDLPTEEFIRESVPCLKFNPAAYCLQPPATVSNSELRSSVITGTLCEPITKPAFLKPTLIDGKLIDIKRKNLAKAAMDTPFIPENEVVAASLPVERKLLHNINPKLRRVLTIEEAVMGSDDSEFLDPMNRSSSPGYPWILERKSNSKGKQQWLGDDEYFIDNKLRNVCNERIELAKLGKRMPTVWVDTLKDERRPVDKVNAGKTRVFANGPMDYTIVFRMYFAGFLAHIMENRIKNEQSIGTNTWANDWTRTARYLQRKGKKVIAGDFSTFDGTLNSCIVGRFPTVVNQFYDDGPQNALIRQVLFCEVFNSVHLFNDIFYMWTHSQPSGCPPTTPLNSYYNSTSMRVVFNRLSKPSHEIVHFLHETRTSDFKGFAEYVYENTPLKESFKCLNSVFRTKLGNGTVVNNIRTNNQNCYLDLIKFAEQNPNKTFIAPKLGVGIFKRKEIDLENVLIQIKKAFNVTFIFPDDIILLPRDFYNKFDEYCTMVSYGDDNVINISDEIIDWFNQQTITLGYATIGMIYTDEAKTDGIPPKYRTLDEVAYLKRKFIYNNNTGVYDAPLDLDTIKEMTNWVRGDLDNKASTLENCSNAIRELSNHSKEIFNENVMKLNKACLSKCGELPVQYPYEDYWEERLLKYFTE